MEIMLFWAVMSFIATAVIPVVLGVAVAAWAPLRKWVDDKKHGYQEKYHSAEGNRKKFESWLYGSFFPGLKHATTTIKNDDQLRRTILEMDTRPSWQGNSKKVKEL